MWDGDGWCCLIPKRLQQQRNQSSLQVIQTENDAVCWDCISFSAIAGMLTSWLSRRRWRYLFLILCTPFLLPLLCATCPFICAVELCFLICRRRRNVGWIGGDGRNRGDEDEAGLLQRYLEDQLLLVSELGGGDGENVEEEGGADVEYFDSTRPLLQ